MCGKIIKLLQLLCLISLLLSLFGSVVLAEEISLTEAFQWGREYNRELRQQKEKLLTLERGMEEVISGLDWQLDFSGKTTYGRGEEIQNLLNTYDYEQNQLKEKGGQITLSLQSKKSYLFGLNIQSDLSITETEPFRFKDVQEKYIFSLDLSQRLYPLLPTVQEKKYYSLENDWKIAQIEYEALLKSSEVDWLEMYYHLVSLKMSQRLVEEKYRLVEGEMERVLQQYQVGEAGKTQLLKARIDLKEAEIALKEASNRELRAKDSFYQALGLTERELELVGSEEYINRWYDWEVDLNYQNLDGLIELVEEDNYRLRALKRKIAFKEREIKWQKAAGKPQLSAIGNYSRNTRSEDEWSVGLGVMYSIFDSGRQGIALAGELAELESLQHDHRQLIKDLRLELQDLQNQLAINLLNLEGKRLALEKAELELELAAEQLKAGIITKQQYQQQFLHGKQAEIDWQTAENQVLISKMRIIDFVGL